jgi:hypothetical protein
MPGTKPNVIDASKQLQMGLSRWDTDGGSGPCRQRLESSGGAGQSEIHPMTDVELEHLRARVIALESLVVTLLVQASEGQLKRAREMAVYISPRPGHTEHPLTVRAAAQMIYMIERAEAFDVIPPS